MGNEANCDLEGMLHRVEDGSFSEVLMTGVFGINISAAGFYECTANNTIEVIADRVEVIIPGLKQHSQATTIVIIVHYTDLRFEHKLAETYIRFSVSDVESLNPCINTPVTVFLDSVVLYYAFLIISPHIYHYIIILQVLSSYDEAAEGAQEFSCRM